MNLNEFTNLNLTTGANISYDLIANDLDGKQLILKNYKGIFLKKKKQYIAILNSAKVYDWFHLNNIHEIRIEEII